MANLHQLLKAMIEKGASDLHITTGSPPQLRIDGALVPLKTPPMTPVASSECCRARRNAKARSQALSTPGNSRTRVNAAREMAVL